MPTSMDSPSPKRLRSQLEYESTDKQKDWISCLPDDVIGYILSCLSSREAQATCLLSRRWRHLSTRLVKNLDFDRSNLLLEMKDKLELVEKERARYVQWVDNVLRSQTGGYYLRRFALCFDLNISYQSHIDRWIRFALAKRVKVLRLDFKPVSYGDLRCDCEPSRLPYLLGQETLMDAGVGCLQGASRQSSSGLSPSSSWHVGFRYLEEITLKRVTVEGELIEQLLANCPVLEQLILKCTRASNRFRFRVSGRSLKLKYLVIAYWRNLERIEIYDTDLVSFTYIGEKIPMCLDKLPQLSEISIGGFMLRLVHTRLSQLSSLSCLQILKLHFFDSPDENLLIHQLPILTRVKQLELRVRGSGDASLLPLTLLIEACPCLQSFLFKLRSPREMLYRQRRLKRVVRRPHQHLKEVEFCNYYGRPCDHELVNYLVKNAIALEKLVVNPCDEEYFPDGMKRVKEPRERALQQLEGKLPSRIELVIN